MTVYVVTGPPAGGKSTWCRNQAKPGDVVIDYDRIANALAPQSDSGHSHPATVKAVTKAARQAAIDTALGLTECDVYLIHSTPSAALLARYRALGAEVVTIDPGIDVVMERVRRERPWQMEQVVKRWYAERASHADSASAASSGLGKGSRTW